MTSSDVHKTLATLTEWNATHIKCTQTVTQWWRLLITSQPWYTISIHVTMKADLPSRCQHFSSFNCLISPELIHTNTHINSGAAVHSDS